MKAIHINGHGLEIPAHEVRSNVTGFISWQRLCEVLRSAHELKKDEIVTSYQIDDRGLVFRVEHVGAEMARCRNGGR